MSRHLPPDGVVAALAAGRSIEQWLGSRPAQEESAVAWVRVDRERDGSFSATLFEVFDEGSPSFLDVYEFTPVDVDLPFGRTRSFSAPEEAITYCESEFGAVRARFVNAGVIQDEYADFKQFARPKPTT